MFLIDEMKNWQIKKYFLYVMLIHKTYADITENRWFFLLSSTEEL